MATGEDGGAGSRRELRNPTLGRGETLREEIQLESGGGPGYDPQTPAEVRWRLGGHASQLARAAAERSPAELGSSGRVIVEAKVLPNYLAASHTPHELIDSSGLAIVGTRPARGEHRTARRDPVPDAPAKVYLPSGSPTDATRLAEFLQPETQLPEKIYRQLSQLDELALGDAETVVNIDDELLEYDDEGRALLEAVMHPQIGEHGVGDEAAQVRNVEAFDKYLATLHTNARHSTAAIDDGVAFLSVAVDPAAIPLVARYTQLRVLRPLSALREPPEFLEAERWELEGILPTVTDSDERIALFDGGLSPRLQELLGDLVTVTDLTNGQAVLPTYERHGGWVTSAALFGHLDPAERNPSAGVPVDAFRVWPPPLEVGRDQELPWVLDRIFEVLQAGCHRVAVITLAPKMNADERAEPHQWTSALDRIAREHDVLICVAAGNTGDLAPSADRLLIPADAINAVSVGAAIATAGTAVRTDYSSVGPGRPGQTTAPTGVQFGGDISAGQPFYALGEDGRVQAVNGTSVAAPVVARACALLRHALDGQADANLLRCLVAHGADRVVGQAQSAAGSTAKEVGLGRLPADIVSHLEHTPDEVTVVYRDTALRGEQIARAIVKSCG